MSEPDEELVDSTAPQHEHLWTVPAIVVAAVFGLLYAWFLYQAIGNLANLPPAYANAGIPERVPWVVLIGSVVLPVVLYLAAAFVGRRASLSNRVLVFAAGLGATSATALALYAASAFLTAVG